MINLDMDKKIRMKQAKNIEKYNKSYSYSRTLNDELRKAKRNG